MKRVTLLTSICFCLLFSEVKLCGAFHRHNKLHTCSIDGNLQPVKSPIGNYVVAHDIRSNKVKFRPDSSMDVGVIAIIHPILHPPLFQSNEVKVVIQNFGLTPATDFDVAFTVNGVEVNANVISRIVAAGDTIHHIFSMAWINTVFAPRITLCAYTKILGVDANPNNDTTCQLLLVPDHVQGIGSILSKVYPNPATDVVYFELHSPADMQSRLLILDMMGKVVKTIALEVDQRLLRIDLHGLVPGIYNYRLERSNGVGRGKLIVVK